MTSPPVLRPETLSAADVDEALRTWGGFLLSVRNAQLHWRLAIAAARDLFARPRAAKANFAIERSSHFRGWSEMRNERDWREQFHLGRDRIGGNQLPPFLTLDGPNLWPRDAEWRRAITSYMEATTRVGEMVLEKVGEALGLDETPFANLSRDGYLVMKLICYHPQSSSAGILHQGVAPHLDFSLLTLTLQDGPGLEVHAPEGGWVRIEPTPYTLWVHAGELLQFASGGRYRACPHRVINHSLDRRRVSIPLFVNPPLKASVRLLADTSRSRAGIPTAGKEHIHHVLVPDAHFEPFHFGEAEWRRKGLGRWCALCVGEPHADSRLTVGAFA